MKHVQLFENFEINEAASENWRTYREQIIVKMKSYFPEALDPRNLQIDREVKELIDKMTSLRVIEAKKKKEKK